MPPKRRFRLTAYAVWLLCLLVLFVLGFLLLWAGVEADVRPPLAWAGLFTFPPV